MWHTFWYNLCIAEGNRNYTWRKLSNFTTMTFPETNRNSPLKIGKVSQNERLPTITTRRWWFQIFFIFIPTWGNDPISRAYFSKGLVQPPTRSIFRCEKVMWKNSGRVSVTILIHPNSWISIDSAHRWVRDSQHFSSLKLVRRLGDGWMASWLKNLSCFFELLM